MRGLCVSVTEGQRMSVDPRSKASASFNRVTTGGVPLKPFTIALHTGKCTMLLGVRDRSEMELDTHLCSSVVSTRGQSFYIAYVPMMLYTCKSHKNAYDI